jgi:hypothetical protein
MAAAQNGYANGHLQQSTPLPTLQPISQKPQVVKHLQNAAFRQGEQAIIQFAVVGTPDTQVKWFKDGAQIESSNKYSVSFDYQTGLCSLTIFSALSEDSGQYTCVVSNYDGNETTSAWIMIQSINYYYF